MRTSRLFAASIVIAIAATSATTAAADPQTSSTNPAAAPSTNGPAGTSHTITLITGDVTRLTTYPDGRQSATIVKQVSQHPGYALSEVDGDLQLVPAEAMPYVMSGQLDRRLFDLRGLVEQGYDDRSRSGGVPVLLAAPGRAKAPPPQPTAATQTTTLDSLQARAITPTRSQMSAFWKSIDDNTPGDGTTTLATGIGNIWLDAQAHTLDDAGATGTTPAPAKTAPTGDGDGVKVAVLDTGYDPKHADLANQVVASKNFVPGATVDDHFGHGTHVASILAGTGAASGGSYSGVAPGADLMIGKVLDDSGSGPLSGIIKGMEWAANNGARIVSMSLGYQAFPSGQKDPVVTALERLSTKTGALFVVAAGNSGPDRRTVLSPGTATDALTVGAVDAQGALADFSSRGPRTDDGATKPEVTALGVDVIAARAANTSLGRDLSRWYTTLSGTSMATPYTAGAAAVLAQAHPRWTGQQLKAALASTAEPQSDTPAYAQGNGRVNLAGALAAKVLPDTGAIGFDSTRAAQTRTVSYRNPTDRPVTVQLAADVRGISLDGGSADIDVTPSTLKIPAHQAKSATVTLRAASSDSDTYAGALVARSGAQTIRTAMGFTVTGPMRAITVTATDRDGTPAGGIATGLQMWSLDDGGELVYVHYDEHGKATTKVPDGSSWSIMSFINTSDAEGWERSVTLMGTPEVTADSDITLHYDARKAVPIDVQAERPTQTDSLIFAWQRGVAGHDTISGWSLNGEITRDIFVGKTTPVGNGTFAVTHRWELNQPELTLTLDGRALPAPRLVSDAGWSGAGRLPIVYAGAGRPSDFEQVNARGAIALVQWTDYGDLDKQVKAAADAGAVLLLFYRDQPGFLSDAAFGAQIPAYALDYRVGKRLRALASQDGSLRVHGVAHSTYRYDLMYVDDEVTGPIVRHERDRMLAAVTTDYHLNNATDVGQSSTRTAWVPGIDVGFPTTELVVAPTRRTDYVSTQGRVQWDDSSEGDLWNWTGVDYGLPQQYRPGEQVTRNWWTAITRPAIPAVGGGAADGLPVARFTDAIRVAIPQYAAGDGSTYGWGDNWMDRTNMQLLRDGKQVGGAKTWSVAQFPVPQATSRYELKLDVTRLPESWSSTSTATHTTWGFMSGHVDGRQVLPLLQVDYGLDTNDANVIRPGSELVLKPGYQPDAAGPGGFTTKVSVSYDKGTTWQAASTSAADGAVRAKLPDAPQGAADPWLRVKVSDSVGNTLNQTIENAWHIS